MTHYKILLIYIFMSSVICSRDSRNTGSTTVWQHPANLNNVLDTPDLIISKDKVELTVYYETLCPASVDFFVTQLKPAVKRLGSHLDVRLIPYGHAKTSRAGRHYVFRCQHGTRECYGNMVHACAIDVLRNNTRSVIFNSCLMQYISHSSTYDDFVSVLSWCAFNEEVNTYDIWKCVNGYRGSVLLKRHGRVTQEINLSYVPYLMLDGSTEHQDEAAYDLFTTVCRLLDPQPLVCRSEN